MFRFALVTTGTLAALAVPAIAQHDQAQPLQRQQFIAQMDAEFQRLDGDGNGMIVPAKIADSQRAAALAQALRQNQAIFAELDTDRNGTLIPQEFARLVNVQAIPTDPTPLINKFDNDKDGIITLIEYRVVTQANFDRIDTAHDGIATEVEMRAAGVIK